MALYHFSAKALSRSGRNTVRAIAYRSGCKLYDERTGESFNYEHKAVEHVELVLPKDAPAWAVDIQQLMTVDRQKGVQAFVDKVEVAEKRIDSQVWREFEFALHRELTKEQNMALAREFVADEICSHGMAAQLNFHFDVDKETGEEKPHCHVTATMRTLEENGLNPKKERDWNKKEFLCDLRVKWEEHSNAHLKLHGHDIHIDHRSHKDRGIEIEPQPKRGSNIIEQEKRSQEPGIPFVTDKMQAFQATQLRNLYRIMRQPDVILDIVTKHHATFMWGDVQKVLHRYVDEEALFQRLETKLKNSNELLVLRPEGDHAIYTTRSMLKAEKELVETAEQLGQSKTHGVEEQHIDLAIAKTNEELKAHGGLSDDQIKAIHHLVDEGQIKCVVGIAGAGKTTALGVCHDIWKAQGYAVYGLTPTGKAAQNLEQSGIQSTTLHKFLKSFEEGRCQYNDKSVLVLDEAGMVDVERFEGFLNAVKTLGVKAVIVGDGAQLQPVEAGPAFRLVTTRLGKSELNTVLRQKENWQREATVLFGKQETKEAIQKYMDKGHVHIIEEDVSQRTDKDFDKREKTKEAVIQAWHTAFKTNPEKDSLILTYSNKDVNDLNRSARSLLKGSGHIAKDEFTYIIKKEIEDDFGRKHTLQEEKGFSKGDRIVFTRNNYGLGVRNGTMGTITNLNKQTIQVKLDESKEISFAPNLNPHFDQGWAVTIHKSQGTTVDRTFVLASYEMTQNLAYVAMTRHREDVHVFGSSLDFWRPEKLPDVLSKSGEKLSAADYLDADSLNKLMQQDDHLLTKIFNRISNELEAMGAVTKQAFWNVADHFLGTKREKEIQAPLLQGGIREEVRAQSLLQQKPLSPALQSTYEEMKHPAFNHVTIVKQAFEKGLKANGEEQAIAYWNTRKEHFLKPYNQNLAKVERELFSPLLNRYTNEWKDQARTFAQEDPAKVLDLVTKVKGNEAARYERIAAAEQARQEKIAAEERATQERQAHHDHIKDTHLRFKSLYDMVKDARHIPEAFKEDLKKFSKELAQDREFMSHLKWKDEDEAEKIKNIAQSKNLDEHFRSLDRGRGGYSL
jgi:Ti-type conjugative transfer relaxase TraA